MAGEAYTVQPHLDEQGAPIGLLRGRLRRRVEDNRIEIEKARRQHEKQQQNKDHVDQRGQADQRAWPLLCEAAAKGAARGAVRLLKHLESAWPGKELVA